MASIVKKEGKTGIIFQVRYRINGRQKAKNFTSKGKNITAVRNAEREAKRFLREIEAKLTLNEVKNQEEITFGKYAKEVLKIKSISLKQSTIDFYTRYFAQVIDEIGHIKLVDMSPRIIDLFLSDMITKKTNKVVEIYMLVLNIVLESAYKEDLIESNPMTKIKFILPKKNKKKVMPVTDQDFSALLEYASDKTPAYGFWARLVYNTGMRVGESLAIKHTDFDYKNRIYFVNKSRDRHGNIGPTKTNKARIGIIHVALEELMNEIIEHQNKMKKLFGSDYNDHDLVICQDDGTPLTYWAIKSFLERFEKQTGIRISPHALRHTFVSKLIVRDNINPKVVQKLVGHSQITTTLDIYTDLFGDRFEESVFEELDEAFSKKDD